MHLYHESLPFAPPLKDYGYVDPSYPMFPSDVPLDGSWVASSCASESEILEHLGSDPVEVVFDTMSVEDEFLSPVFPDTMGQEWTDIRMAATDGGFPLGEHQRQHPESSESSSLFHHTHYSSLIGGFHGNMYNQQSHHSPPTSAQFQVPTTSFDVAAAANLDMMYMMSLDASNQDYYSGYINTNTAGSDMSSYGFGNSC
jgi:hypothetical protein